MNKYSDSNQVGSSGLRFNTRMFPIGWIIFALICFTISSLAVVVLASAPNVKADHWLVVPFLAAIGTGFSWMALRGACILRIGNTIEHRKAWKQRVFPLDKAMYIRVNRSLIMPSTVDGYLIVNDSGYESQLQFSEYSLFGVRDEAKVKELARLLNIRIEDPLGERWRSSSCFLVRWMGSGRLWSVWLLFFLAAVPIVYLAVILR